MYVPAAFAESDLATLHEFIERHGFGLLCSQHGGTPLASHLPLLIDRTGGAQGTLRGHMARANPQWRGGATDGLAIFMGPDSYITPSYYATKRETEKVVPTWNYVTIHAYGQVSFSEDLDELLNVVTRLTDRQEGKRVSPWAVSDAPPKFIQAQLKGIIALRMPITRLQGKWKMSQNRTDADRAGVVDGLRADGNETVAAMVADLRAPSGG